MKHFLLALCLLAFSSIQAITNDVELIGNTDFSTNVTPAQTVNGSSTAGLWYVGDNTLVSWNTSGGFIADAATGAFVTTTGAAPTNAYDNFLGQITTESTVNTGRYHFSIAASGTQPFYIKISSTLVLGTELTYVLRNPSSASIEKQGTADYTGYSLKITPTGTTTTYTADLDLTNSTPSAIRIYLVFPKIGSVTVDNISLKRTKDIPTTYYIRPTGNTTAWTSLVGIDADQIVTGSALSIDPTFTYYLAAGNYTTAGLSVTSGKIYGGFSGNETSINLNSRVISDLDLNGNTDPWEFTNEASITSSLSNSKFTESGTSTARLLVVSGNGGEVNGISLTDFNYITYAGPIYLGKAGGGVADTLESLAGTLRLCTIKKIKSALDGAITVSNPFSLIDRCLIENTVNLAGNSGGAINLKSFGGKVEGCMIRNNVSAHATAGRGGGIYISANSAASQGSGNINAIVKNCIIYNNAASAQGGGLRVDAIAAKRGVQVINSTIVNNKTGYGGGSSQSSVEFVNAGLLVNSIVVNPALTETGTEVRNNTANAYITKTVYGDHTQTAGLVTSGNSTGKITSDLNFKAPTTFSGVSIPDYTTPWDATAISNYNAIRQANFSITNTGSIAVTNPGDNSLPASYTTSAGTVVIIGTVPTTDITGLTRTGNKTIGAYQATLEVANGTPMTVDQNANLATITVAPGAQLSLNAGKILSANTLTIQSSVAGTGTFVNNGTATATSVSVQQYLTGANSAGTPNGRYWYLTTPVTGSTSNAFTPATNYLWSYNESGNSLATVYTRITATDAALTPGTGYIARMADNGTVSLTGTALFNDNKTFTNLSYASSDASKKGFNLIGNPYPSYIDLTSAFATATGYETSAWYRSSSTGTNNVFDTFNATTGAGITLNSDANAATLAKIPPMQAFWVRVNNATNSLTISKTSRSHKPETNGNNLRSASVSGTKQIRLNVSNGSVTDQTLIGFYGQASDGFENCDSRKMFNGIASLPEIYSLAGSTEVAINGLPLLDGTKEIALGFKTAQAGNFTIKAAEILNLDEDQTVFLKDKLLNICLNMTEQPEYSFTSDATTTTSRFSLVIGKTATAIKQTQLSNFDVRNLNGGRMEIALDGSAMAKVSVYDAVGRLVQVQDVLTQTSTLDKAFGKGVYFVKATIKGSEVTKKVVINN